MKKFIYTFSVLTMLLTLSSCKKYLDINKNPNAAEEIDPKLLFSYATVAYIDLRTSGDLYIPMSLAGQTLSNGGNNPTGWSGGDPDAQTYVFSANFLNNSWVTLYVRAGANLKQAIKLSEAASPANNNAAAQCKVLLAMATYDITTTFGDVPFTEAWNPSILYPHFDDQKTVLQGVIGLLDQALAQFDESSPLKIGKSGDTAYDLFYGGDIGKWKRLAKSLKLRTLLTMVDKDPTKATDIGAIATAGTASLVNAATDNAKIAFVDVAGKRNPKYAISLQYNGGLNFFFASKYVTDIMDPVVPFPVAPDPRLPKYFDKPSTAAKYVGVVPGADAVNAANPRIAATLQSPAAPEVMFTLQEELFNEAEIYARGLGVAVDLTKASTLYRTALAESCKFFGVSSTDAATFANQFPNFTTAAQAIQAIHEQQWVDKMDRGLDAFTQWRRSGPEGSEVPALTLPVGAPAGGLFRRYEYPIVNEISANPNAPKTTIKYNVKMWFDL